MIMDMKIDQSPVTTHGDGTTEGSNLQNIELINRKGNNKFLDKFNQSKRTDTEQLLMGLPDFILKDMSLYFLFENYPKRNNYTTGMLETFVNQLNIDHIKNNKLFDIIQWCKMAINARTEGIESGYAFLDYCDQGLNKDFGYLDILANVKNEMPIDEYLKGMSSEETLEYLSESSFNYMVKRISKNKFLFEQCEDYESLTNVIERLRNGEDVEEEYLEYKKKIERNRQKYYRMNKSNINKSALECGFTANLSEEECRSENQRNLRMEETGCNKFKFGHRWLNLVTGGGLESKQLMVYGAPSGNGKTSMLISSAIDMALYNGDVKYDPKYTPCILYISAETGLNDIKSRYIKMLTGMDTSWDDDIKGEKCYLSKEEIEDLLVQASNVLARRTPTKIRFIQVPNGSYTKNEIMRDIELLKENENLQTVAVIADYLKGFRPTENSSEARLVVENTVTDLRAVAIECDVAVITASQIKGDVSEEITKARTRYETQVIPECNEYVFSESKGVLECCDFGVLFAQTSNKYERIESTKAVKYTHLEAMVLKTRAGQHNRARAFIPYVEGSQVAFQKDIDLFDENNKPVWLTTGELDYIGDPANKILMGTENGKRKAQKLFSKPANSSEGNLNREKDTMDDLPGGFFNSELANIA